MSITHCLLFIMSIWWTYQANWVSANLNSSVNVNNEKFCPPSSAQIGIDYNQQTSLGSLKISNDLYGKYNCLQTPPTQEQRMKSSLSIRRVSFNFCSLLCKGKRQIKLQPKLLSFNDQENDICAIIS